MFTWYVSLILPLTFLIHVNAIRKQGVAVRGQLLCGSGPANQTKVRIVDIDTGPDPDDKLDEKIINSDGRFELNGSTRELTDIDPDGLTVLFRWMTFHRTTKEKTLERISYELFRISPHILHPCQRKITFKIPKKFIHTGEPKPEQWIDIGTLNLQGHFEEEGRECSH
uniref:Transthyretin-like family protein n=1 Tax=Elaeophora elaphi TaxID=1147741 RepID=A0A0R3RID5_9BILA